MHWLAHWLGLDNASGPVYLAWSGVVGTSVIGGLGTVLRWLMRRHHAEALAQSALHHAEALAQAAEHHKELKAQTDRHHQQRLDQADALHEALKAHITAQTPTPPAAALDAARSRNTGSGT